MINSTKHSAIYVLLLGTSNLMAVGQAVAQDKNAPPQASIQADEIIVTAQRREQRLQDVPIAITALSAEDLSERAITDVQGLSGVAPSLNIGGNTGTGGSATLAIRGLSGANTPIGQSQTVAVYIDGIYVPRVEGALFTLDDVERIEVLRGPQGTLYGRNSTGGAINIITSNPGDTLRGGADVSYGNYNHFLAKGSLSGPLGAGFSAGISGVYEKRDGFYTNSATGHELGDYEGYTVRGKLRYVSPDDRFDAVLTGDYSRVNPVAVFQNLYSQTGVALDIGKSRVVTVPVTPTNFEDLLNVGNVTKVYGFGLTMNLKASDDVTVTSVTGYRHSDFDGRAAGLGTPSARISIYSSKARTFSHEVRAVIETGPVHATVGANYYREETSFAFPPPNAVTLQTGSKLDAYAGFGQLEIDLTSRLSVMGGLRFNRETRDFYTNYITPISRRTPGRLADSTWIPSAGINFKPTDDILLYAKYSRGYQAPGFNGSPGPTSTTPQVADAEHLNAYEVGAKTQFLDRKVTFNIDYFHYDYSNLQVRTSISSGNIVLTNAGAAVFDGVEGELTVRPIKGLTLSGNLSWVDAHYTDFCEPDAATSPKGSDPSCATPAGLPGGDRAGNKIQFAPKWQGNVGARYTVPIGGAGDLSLSTNYSWQSNSFFSPGNDPLTSTGKVERLDARIGFQIAGGPEIYVYGRNLTDSYSVTFAGRQGDGRAATAPNQIFRVLNDPRTYGVGINYRF
ncbi:TonB-dependent receptor [soil metagenome]